MAKKSEGGSTFFGVPLVRGSCSRGGLRCYVTGEEGRYSFRVYYKGALISFPYRCSPAVASALQAAENVTVAWLGGLAQLLEYKLVPAKKVAEALEDICVRCGCADVARLQIALCHREEELLCDACVDAQGGHGFVSADFEEE